MDSVLSQAVLAVQAIALTHPTKIVRAPIGSYWCYEDRHVRLRAPDRFAVPDYSVSVAEAGNVWADVLRWTEYGVPSTPMSFRPGSWVVYLGVLARCGSRELLDWRAAHWTERAALWTPTAPAPVPARFERVRTIACDEVIIATDGSRLENKRGGWAYILRHNGLEHIGLGRAAKTTSVIMELTAIAEALRYLRRLGFLSTRRTIRIITDLEQVVRRFTKANLKKRPPGGWCEKKPAPENVLLDEIYELVKPHSIIWTWIRGHGENSENRQAHYLSQVAAGLDGPANLQNAGISAEEWAAHTELLRP